MFKIISIFMMLGILPYTVDSLKSNESKKTTLDPCNYDWTYSNNYSYQSGHVLVTFSLQSADRDINSWSFGVNPAYVQIISIESQVGATVLFNAYGIAQERGANGSISFLACANADPNPPCSTNQVCKTITMLVP